MAESVNGPGTNRIDEDQAVYNNSGQGRHFEYYLKNQILKALAITNLDRDPAPVPGPRLTTGLFLANEPLSPGTGPG